MALGPIKTQNPVRLIGPSNFGPTLMRLPILNQIISIHTFSFIRALFLSKGSELIEPYFWRKLYIGNI